MRWNSFILVLIILVLIPGVLAGTITRDFSSLNIFSDENLSVSLVVDVDAGDRVYSIEEILPAQATILDSGDGSVVGTKIRWLEYFNVQDTTKNYIVSFSNPGVYDFSGTYVFNSESSTSLLS